MSNRFEFRTYHANGNLLADGYPDWNPELGYGGDARLFEWDAKNRLKAVTVIAHGTIGNYWGSTLTRYRWDYDYRDRRVREWLCKKGKPGQIHFHAPEPIALHLASLANDAPFEEVRRGVAWRLTTSADF